LNARIPLRRSLEAVMDINPNAPGNISQKGKAGATDNETGFDPTSETHVESTVDSRHPAENTRDPNTRKYDVDDRDGPNPGDGAI
jgi:hypothetical protein